MDLTLEQDAVANAKQTAEQKKINSNVLIVEKTKHRLLCWITL